MHFLVSMLSTLGQPGPGARRSRRRAGKANVDVAAIRDGMSVAGVVAKGSGERVAVRGGVLDVMIVAGVAVRRAEEGGREGFRREDAVAGRRLFVSSRDWMGCARVVIGYTEFFFVAPHVCVC